MQELRHRRIGDVVKENYARAAAFQQFGLDFCCGGGKTVEAACAANGIDAEDVLAALEVADAGGGDSDPALDKTPAELAQYITEVHHGYVRRTLPALMQFSEKVARVHGATYPQLVELAGVVSEMAREMTEHMEAEETGIFAQLTGAEDPAAVEGIDQLEDEHEHVGGLMRRARELTDGFRPPEGACATYRATFALLEEFESDLHRHVHLENNVLFPTLA